MDRTTLITTDGALLKTEIEKLAKREKLRVRDIHVLAMGVTLHAIQHGDFTLCTRLVDAISGKDSKSVVTWLCEFAPLSVGKVTVKNEAGEMVEANGFIFDAERRAALKLRIAKNDGRKAFIAEMNEKTYDDLSPVKPFEGLEFLALLKGIVKRAQTTADKHKGNDKVNLRGLAEAKLLIASLSDDTDEDGSPEPDGGTPAILPANAAADEAAASIH